jgi:hypothetical protein
MTADQRHRVAKKSCEEAPYKAELCALIGLFTELDAPGGM